VESNNSTQCGKQLMDKRRVLKSEKTSKHINTDKFPRSEEVQYLRRKFSALRKFNTYVHKQLKVLIVQRFGKYFDARYLCSRMLI